MCAVSFRSNSLSHNLSLPISESLLLQVTLNTLNFFASATVEMSNLSLDIADDALRVRGDVLILHLRTPPKLSPLSFDQLIDFIHK